MCCLHKHTVTLSFKESLLTIGITGMPNATTNNSRSKKCNPNDQSASTPPLVEMWDTALPTPVSIDGPACK